MSSPNNESIKALVLRNLACAVGTAEEALALRTLGLNGLMLVADKSAADAMAADTTTLEAGALLSRQLRFSAFYLQPLAACTANDTTYATITLKVDDGAAGSATTLATQVTTVAGGSWVNGTLKTMTNTATTANLIVDGYTAVKQIQFAIAKASTGVVVPKFRIWGAFEVCGG